MISLICELTPESAFPIGSFMYIYLSYIGPTRAAPDQRGSGRHALPWPRRGAAEIDPVRRWTRPCTPADRSLSVAKRLLTCRRRHRDRDVAEMPTPLGWRFVPPNAFIQVRDEQEWCQSQDCNGAICTPRPTACGPADRERRSHLAACRATRTAPQRPAPDLAQDETPPLRLATGMASIRFSQWELWKALGQVTRLIRVKCQPDWVLSLSG